MLVVLIYIEAYIEAYIDVYTKILFLALLFNVLNDTGVSLYVPRSS